MREKRKFQERSDWQESNEKGGGDKVIEGQEVQKDGSFEHFLPTDIRNSF